MRTIKRFSLSAMSLVALATSNAHAQSREVGPYTISEASESCTAWTRLDLPGRAPITINWLTFADKPESAHLLLESDDWSAVKDQSYDGFVFQFSNPDTYVQGLPVRGVGDGGFTVELPMQALAAFASAQRFTVARGDDPASASIILDMRLTGSSAAVRSLKNCTEGVARKIASRADAEASVSHITRDPFASDIPSQADRTWIVRPRPEYPELALQAGINRAQVDLSCDVSADGSLNQCEIVKEDPQGYGFGAAAIKSALKARAGAGDASPFTFRVVFSLL